MTALQVLQAHSAHKAHLVLTVLKARKGFRIILDKHTWTVNAPPLPSLSFSPDKFARAAFKLMDGNWSIGQIAELVRKQFANRPSTKEVHSQFSALFRMLCEWGECDASGRAPVRLSHGRSRARVWGHGYALELLEGAGVRSGGCDLCLMLSSR